MIELAVTGACGRMGQRIIALAQESGAFKMTAAVESAGHERMGTDVGEVVGAGPCGIPVSEAPSSVPQVMIDFTTPASAEKWLSYCVANKVGMVMGTTGLSDAQRSALARGGEEIAVVFAANMSLGMNLLFKLAHQVSQPLVDDFDV